MRVHTLRRKIERNLEDHGFGHTLKRSLSYLLTPIFEKKVYMIYGIDLSKLKQVSTNYYPFSFRILTHHDVGFIRQIEEMEEWLCGKVESKLQKGSLCLLALNEREVIGFNLISFNEVFIPLVKVSRVLKEDEAWSEQITVRRDHRRKGLATELRFRAFAELKKRGIRKFYGGALVGNYPNVRLTRKVGFRKLGDIHYLKIFHLRKWQRKGLTDDQFWGHKNLCSR